MDNEEMWLRQLSSQVHAWFKEGYKISEICYFTDKSEEFIRDLLTHPKHRSGTPLL